MQTTPPQGLYRFIILVLLLYCSGSVYSQRTEKYSKINFQPKTNLFHAVDSFSSPDTIPERFQQYHPLYRNEIAFLDQGNIVSAYQPLIFNAERQTGLDMGIQQAYRQYLFLPENIRVFKVRRAYTDLFYAQGGKEFINLKATHAQNITPNWNVGIEFNRTKSDGFQLRQKMGVYNTRFFNWYHSKNERYHLVVTATWNRLTNQENGGIQSDSAFEANTAISQVAVKMGDNFDPVRTQIKTNDYRVTNMYRLGPKKGVKYYIPESDSYAADSTPVFIPTWVVSHEFAYSTNRYLYRDLSFDTGTYYQYTFFNPDQTFDSIQHNVISNAVTISTAPFMHYLKDSMPVKRLLMFAATAGHQYHTIAWQTVANAAYTSTYVGGKLFSNPYISGPVTFGAEGTFWLTGYNQADYKVKGNLTIAIGDIALHGNALFQAYQPQIMQFFFLGNHNFWKNDFDKTFVNTLSAGISTRRLRNNYHLTVGQQLVNNYIYFDSALQAQQEARAISITSVSFRKKFQAGKFFLDNNVTAQFTNNTAVLRIPQIATRNSFYFQSYLFRKAMYAQIGVDFFYYSGIKANTYDPETRQYYLQNGVQIGNYPLLDVFLVGHIQTFSFFLKVEHTNMGYSGTKRYASPHYPLPPRVFRLGIAWKFFD